MSKKKGIKENAIKFLVFLPVLAYITLRIFNFMYETHPTSYMDEIFHIPQAQLYCRNVWNKWNPKITTLPGLYLVSYLIVKPLELFNGNICSAYTLRFVNLLGTLINFLLTYKIMSKLHNFSSARSTTEIMVNVLSAVNLTIFPPLYFFTFLYYTDVWSLTFVLFMYYGYVSAASKFLIATAGVMAVLMRQTNIIWVGFMILNIAWDILVKSKELKKLKTYNFKKINKKTIQKCIHYIKNNKVKLKSVIKEIILATYPSVLVCIAFIFFLLFNGSVVLGDRKAHTVVLHPMQNLYFLDFVAFFGIPYFTIHILSRKLPSIHVLLLLTCLFAIISELNKLEHPYLVADNRHLAFYIWKRIFGHSIMRRAVIPTYTVAAVVLWDLLRQRQLMFKVFLGLCIFFNLTLQHLFELRYFIIPFVLCRLSFRQNKAVLIEFLFFSLINFSTIYIFATKPFSWSSEPDMIQRFIW